jgi:hypothetical protein
LQTLNLRCAFRASVGIKQNSNEEFLPRVNRPPALALTLPKKWSLVPPATKVLATPTATTLFWALRYKDPKQGL